MNYREDLGRIVVDDITKKDTVDNEEIRINELKGNAEHNVVRMLSGNKLEM